jgi:16S rRNA C967 or C1407 C5-methylase (RsmB/RsmF family)
MGNRKKKKVNGVEQFNVFYESVYGDRWETLKKSLLSPSKHILLHNPFSSYSTNLKNWMPHAYHVVEEMEPPGIGPLAPYYFMDGASYLAAYYLDPKEGEKVLDLCAAPGGKSLALAFLMNGEGHLTSNDKSTDRRFRLLRVLRSYLPQDFLDSSLRVTGFDASEWCLYETNAYDKILLDVPCSSEEHVMESEKHLSEWTEKRTKRLSALQWKMLASSWLVLKDEGRLVYSTCSISPYENDAVVEKLIKKHNVKVIHKELNMGTKTKYGHLLLPDECNFGPFYFAILEKSSQ